MAGTTTTPSLKGRVAIITGAGKGLGKAYALHLAELGAAVVVNNRAGNSEPGQCSADRVANEIREAGGQAVANYDSVEDPGAAKRLISQALDNFGHLDTVVSNAGIDSASTFQKLDMRAFEQIMDINFGSVVRLLHAAWPHLLDAGQGRVVVSTSTAGLYGNRGQAAYAASKAALLGLAKTLAIEGAPHGLRVNAIAPYAVTQLTVPWFPQEQVAQFASENVAGVVGWLGSHDCSLSGQTVIAGAHHMRLARHLETATLRFEENPGNAVEQLSCAPCQETSPASAAAEFDDFMRSVGGQTTVPD